MLKFKIELGATDAQIDAVIRCLEALKSKGQSKFSPQKSTKTKEEPALKEPAKQEEPQKTEVGAITLDMVREAVAEKKDDYFKAMKAELENVYKAPNVTKLDPKDYQDFYNFVKNL